MKNRDLSLCLRQFEPGSQRLEATDERFQDIVDIVERGKYTEAADKVAELLAENSYEVHLLGYYLYAVFHEDGLSRLPEVLDTQVGLIQRNWAALPAGDKQAVLLNKSVKWLFGTLMDTLLFHQKKKDERWQGWTRELPPAQVQTAVQRAQQLLELLPEPTYHSSAEQVIRLSGWLRDLGAQLTAAQSAQAAQAEPARPTPQAPPPPSAPDASTFLKLGQVVQLRGSAQFVDLLNKLKAFELLVQAHEFQKAALVSDDILSALKDFDPRRYFPELFSTFGALLHKHVQQIQPHWEHKESPEWQMLAQFYQVDLENFVGRKN